jgi:hypothetical protein
VCGDGSFIGAQAAGMKLGVQPNDPAVALDVYRAHSPL